MTEQIQPKKGGTSISQKEKVYGDRICLNCKGICHKDSVRETVGQRKSYWCSENCLRIYLKEKYSRLPADILENLFGGEYPDYEKVDVITK